MIDFITKICIRTCVRACVFACTCVCMYVCVYVRWVWILKYKEMGTFLLPNITFATPDKLIPMLFLQIIPIFPISILTD